MKNQTMKVLPVPGRLLPNFEAFEAGVRRFIGWKYDPMLGEVDAKGMHQGGFAMVPDGELVPVRAEYIQALRQGDLRAADDTSAKFVISSLNLSI